MMQMWKMLKVQCECVKVAKKHSDDNAERDIKSCLAKQREDFIAVSLIIKNSLGWK